MHIIPWYVINQKLSKKWFLCKLYPAANMIGGNKKLKNNSVSKFTSSLKIYIITINFTYFINNAVNIPNNIATTDSCKNLILLIDIKCAVSI